MAVREAPSDPSPIQGDLQLARLPPHPTGRTRSQEETLTLTRLTHTLALAVALCALAMPAVAGASPSQVIRDCQTDGDLDRKYSNKDLRKAEDNLPADVREYSDCGEVIAAAVTAGSARKGDGGGGGGGGTGATSGGADSPERQANRAEDDAALEQLKKERRRPEVSVGGRSISPGDNGLFNVASSTNGLPLPLLLALIGVLLVALVGGLLALRRRFPAIGRLPLLSKIRLPRVPTPHERS